MPTSTRRIDPDLAVLCKQLYGYGVDLEATLGELSKGPDASEVHVDTAVGGRPKRPKVLRSFAQQVAKADDEKRDKKGLAAGLLAGSAIEAAAANDTIQPLKQGVRTARPALKQATTVGQKAKALKPLVAGGKGRFFPVTRGPATSAALQVGNFAVGLAAAKTLLKPKEAGPPQAPAAGATSPPVAAPPAQPSLKPKKPEMAKALRLSLKPLNPQPGRVPSLKARRPATSASVAKRGSVASEVDLEGELEITKAVDEKMQVFGWANVSKMNGEVVRDRQGDSIDIHELEKAAYDYVLDSRVGGDQHRRAGEPLRKSLEGAPSHHSTMIESMVFTPEKIEKMGLPEDFPQAWWVGYQLHDPEVWEMVKSGERTGFSVHGTGRRTPITKRDDPPRARAAEAAGEQGAKVVDRGGATLRTRLRQAKNPPPVTRTPVESSAVRSVGYRPQTRELSVEMHSKPGEPYNYRAKKKVARRVVGAPSAGKAYNREVRNKLPHKERYSVADRARLFARPDREPQRETVGKRLVLRPVGSTA